MNKREIRRNREAQQLLSLELARRLGVSPARVSVLERDELKGAVTMRMMARAAEALDCEFVYELVPKTRNSAAKPRLKCQQQDTAAALDVRIRAVLSKPDRA